MIINIFNIEYYYRLFSSISSFFLDFIIYYCKNLYSIYELIIFYKKNVYSNIFYISVILKYIYIYILKI